MKVYIHAPEGVDYTGTDEEFAELAARVKPCPDCDSDLELVWGGKQHGLEVWNPTILHKHPCPEMTRRLSYRRLE